MSTVVKTMKVAILSAVVAMAAFGVWADTETVGDYTWTYQINGDTAEITGVSPSTGAVTIPATLGGKPVTSIWHWAFSGCSGLESVTIPDSVTSIGSGAFSDCSGLTSVTIPDSVTSIESSAFSGCSGLTRVAIGNGLTYVGYGVFGNCTAIRDAELPGWKCEIPMENVERLVISQGTANIVDYAFRECGNLKSVTVPNSVTSIGDSAFSYCSGLTSVTIPGSVENIGLGAFSHCSNLKGVTISPGVRSVGEQAFSECRVLESVAIPDSVTNIAGSAFSNCIGLKSVSIPGSMTNVNSSVFYGCSGVTNLTASFVPVGMSASQLQTVVIPADTVCIKDWAFRDCSGLTGVTIPDGVTSIGIGAFQCCSGLKSVAIPDSVTSIRAYSFYGCSSLESATIPNSVTDIDFTAFLDGGSLANVAIPQCVCNGNESVMSLFGTNITNVVVSAGVTSIGRSTFYDCSNLRSVTIPGSVASIANYAFEDCAALRSVFFEGNAPNSVGSSLFSYYAKDFCRAYVHKGTTGWGVAIPGTWNGINISYIEDGFVEPVDPPLATYKVAYEPGAYGSGQSQSATKTYGKPLVLAGALFTRSGYTQTGWSVSPNGYWLNYALGAEYTANDFITLFPYWTVDGGGEIMSETVNGLTWNFVVSDGEATIFGGRYLEWDDEEEDYTWEYIVAIPSDTSGTVTVPSSLGGYPVTAIGDGVFTECERITSVVIPSGVVSIGEDAFSDCTALVSVSLPEGLVTIGNDAFDGCGRLSMVTLPSTLATIGSRAFDGCSSLYSMDIPGKVKTIGYHAFARCTGLRTVTVSELLRSQITSNGVFYKCSPAISYNDAGMVTVTFDPNGGIGGSSVKQDYGSAIVAPTVRRTGYTFTGWQPLPLETVPSNDVAYTAQWIANSYTVKFNANGAEGTMADQPMTYDVPAGFSAIGFSKDDSYFRGWAKSADGAVVYPDCAIVTNLTSVADGVVTLYAVWLRKSTSALACEDMFAGTGTVWMNDDGSSVVTLTNDVSGTVEIPDNVGAVTIDLNGHDIVGDGGPAMQIVKGDGEGDATQLAIVDTSDGEKGRIAGGGESAGIEVAEDAATGVKLDVEEGVGVFNGDGSEQELKPKLVGTGKVTVPKTWKVGQKVTWKATADKGSVFAHWEGPLVDSLNLTKNERRNPSLAFAVPEGFETNMVTAVFLPIDDDGLGALGIGETDANGRAARSTGGDVLLEKGIATNLRVTDDSQSYVTASASGLPSGLKFDAKKMCITGAPTKGGVYWVQIKAKNASGYQWAENVKVTVSGDGKEAKEPKLMRTTYYPLTVICATEGGTVSGTGVYAEGKKVTIKATAAKGHVFAGWYDESVKCKMENEKLGSAASMSVIVPEMRYVFAKFVTAEEDRDSIELAVNGVEMAAGAGRPPYQTNIWAGVYMEWPVAASALSEMKVKVAGLPSGLKFTEKPVTSKIGSGKTAVTVTNVPAYTIYGAPTAASKTTTDRKTGEVTVTPSAVKITVTTAGKSSKTYQIDTFVDALPAWAVGTFDGVSGDGRDGARPSQGDADAQERVPPEGLVTVTVAANGKISGKLINADGTWTLNAASFDGVRLAGDGSPHLDPEAGSPMSDVGSPVFVATVIGKNGKMAITNEMEVSAEAVNAARSASGPYQRGVVSARSVIAPYQNSESPVEWTAWQNLWKVEPWKSEAKAFAKAKPVEFVASVSPVPFSSGVVTLKFAASGAVTASGKFVTGQDAMGKDVVYSASCSSVLVPEAGAAGAGRPPYRIFLYFPPKAGKFDGYAAEIPLEWDGAAFTLRE